MLHQFGRGKTVFTAFDLGRSLTPDTYDVIESLLRKSIAHIHRKGSDPDKVLPHHGVPVSLMISGFVGERLRIEQRFSNVWFHNTFDQSFSTDSPWTRDLDPLPDDPQVFQFWFAPPDEVGTYSTTGEIGSLVDDLYTYIGEDSLEFEVMRDFNTLITDSMVALDSAPVAGWDRWKINKALYYLRRARARGQTSKCRIARNITDILKAIAVTRLVRSQEMTERILELDDLLKIEQGAYYLWDRK